MRWKKIKAFLTFLILPTIIIRKDLSNNKFKMHFKTITKAILWVWTLSVLGSSNTFAIIPDEYYTNYETEGHWNRVSESFVKIQAARNLGQDPSPELFKILHDNFEPVFKIFPQEHNFKITYEQCLNLSDSLSKGYSTNTFQSFKNNCENPLNQITSKIDSQYTVKPSASASPASWPAPLTVTFDARSSRDPSNETIPQNNYYWYYRDINGIDKTIGIGSLISYTFDEPGNYIIHLTVKSSNKGIGYMDGGMDLRVTVNPKNTNIIVYANEKKDPLSKTEYNKFGIAEWKKGIIFDASATTTKDGREILKTIWEIQGKQTNFFYKKEFENRPSNINVPLTEEGPYTLKVTTIDNEKNTTTESFQIVISDPVAKIKQSPESWTTSTTYKFDASTSYALTSRLKLYTWEVFDNEGKKITTAQGKVLSKQFTQPWDYLVKLTIEDEIWHKNTDTKQIRVESSTPFPQFTITSTNKREKSSEFILNADSTLDLDMQNKLDSLDYKWKFSDPEFVQIINTEENNKIVTVRFNKRGKHTITLEVTDKYGKTASIKKDIEVQSILRPELNLSVNATTWNKEITFQVQSNEKVLRYDWDFWDGDSKSNQIAELTHIYKKAWIYTVKVTVTDEHEETNTVREKVFIWEDNQPIPAYKVKVKDIFLQPEDGVCLEEDGTKANAYLIERYQTALVDPSISVNTKGTNAWLNYYFQTKDNQIQKQNSYNFKSNEVGCQFVDMTVEDTNIGKQKKERIRFKVINSLPVLSNLTISFPQYNNESGIGFQENNIKNIYDNAESDNLIVKVTAQNAHDPDGNIARFFWYYYPKENPNKILETRSTPGDINYTFFTVPRIPGEYMFGVKMYDNDEAQNKSEDIIGNGPTVFFPPTNNNPDIPIVTLKSDKQSIVLGDTVQFDVISKILSENKNFVTDRVIYYDFDGDGERDLTTKNDRVTYTYTKPNEQGYHPRAAVEYKGYKGISEGNDVIVKSGIKPILTFNSIGNYVIVRDLSIGDLKERYICFEKAECDKGNKNYRKIHFDDEIQANSVLLHKYDDYGEHTIVIKAKSKGAIETEKEYKVKTTKKETNGKIASGVNFITIPEAIFDKNDNISIFANKEMKNQISFYVYYNGAKKSDCFVDVDISADTNHDGNPKNDKDLKCNTLETWNYGSGVFEPIMGRLYFKYQGETTYKTFTVEFENDEIPLEGDMLDIYKDISTLINGIEEKNNGNAYLRIYLDQLRKNLLDRNATSSTVVEIQNLLNENVVLLDSNQDFLLNSILERLANADTVSALWWNEYEKAKSEILSILPDELADSVTLKFVDFESVADRIDNDEKKAKLNDILNFIVENANKYDMDVNDIENVIVKNFCNILNFYEISSNKCGVVNETPTVQEENTISNTVNEDTTTPSKGLPTRLKIILWVVISAILIVGGVIVFFAIKAKMKDENEEEDEEE